MPQTNYDDIAKAFDAYDADAKTDIELGHANIVKMIDWHNDIRILDFGCGTGKVSRYLAKRGALITGVDISAREIEIANKRNNGANAFYRHMPQGHIDFVEPCSKDAVVLSFVLCTIPTKEEIIRVLQMCKRVLRRQGQLIILNNNMEASHGREFVSFSIPHLENPQSGDLVQVKLGKLRNLIVNDYYWTDDDYCNMIVQSGLNPTITYEPRAKAREGWRDEFQYPPFKLFSAYRRSLWT